MARPPIDMPKQEDAHQKEQRLLCESIESLMNQYEHHDTPGIIFAVACALGIMFFGFGVIMPNATNAAESAAVPLCAGTTIVGVIVAIISGIVYAKTPGKHTILANIARLAENVESVPARHEYERFVTLHN